MHFLPGDCMRSDVITKGIEKAPSRSLLRADGLTDADFKKPFIGIANSWNEVIPGHIHLNELVEEVKRGIKDAGGVPFTFGIPGICDGIAMGHYGMRYSLASRETISDCVELMVMAHCFDGWVGVTNCDKITPGMLMAAGRCDLPTVIVTGGPMEHGESGSQRLDLQSVFEVLGEYKAGKVDKEQVERIEGCACPGAGSCAGLFTANTMACLTEVLGIEPGRLRHIHGQQQAQARDSLPVRKAHRRAGKEEHHPEVHSHRGVVQERRTRRHGDRRVLQYRPAPASGGIGIRCQDQLEGVR